MTHTHTHTHTRTHTQILERDPSQNHSSTKKCLVAKLEMQKFSQPFPSSPIKTDSSLSSHTSKESLTLQD